MAVKTLNSQYLETGKDNFLREAQVMVCFDHPFIVKLIGVCEAETLMLVSCTAGWRRGCKEAGYC